MNVVFVASEAVPFAKTGGLGDVAGALPRALAKRATRWQSFLPCYRRAWAAGVEIRPTGITLRSRSEPARSRPRFIESRLPGSDVRVYLIDQPAISIATGSTGDGKDYDDNCERFVFFNRAVLEAIRPSASSPTSSTATTGRPGLIPVYMKTLYQRAAALCSAGIAA